jgi:hypothetical protein
MSDGTEEYRQKFRSHYSVPRRTFELFISWAQMLSLESACCVILCALFCIIGWTEKQMLRLKRKSLDTLSLNSQTNGHKLWDRNYRSAPLLCGSCRLHLFSLLRDGRACRTQCWSATTKGRDQLEEKDVDWRIILKQILRHLIGCLLATLMWFRVQEQVQQSNKPSGPIKGGDLIDHTPSTMGTTVRQLQLVTWTVTSSQETN